jgi:WhiB family transcriptional regulator, redox-sensing transcriptional regulator
MMSLPEWSWTARAACKGLSLDLFFGPDGERGPRLIEREAEARAVCAGCPVRLQCGNYAVGTPEKYGVWGGFGEDERDAERRRRRRRVQGRAA